MAAKDDKDEPKRRIRLLMAELADAKLKRARAFSHLRTGQVAGRAATVEDARFGSLERISDAQSPNVRARDPEIIRVELAIALSEVGVTYPPQDG